MRGEIIVLQEVKDQRREKSIKENALFQASNRRFSPAGAAAALWAQRAHPGGTRGLLLVQLRANRLKGYVLITLYGTLVLRFCTT